MDVRVDALKTAIDALVYELKKEPLSPERVLALSEAIKTLHSIRVPSQH